MSKFLPRNSNLIVVPQIHNQKENEVKFGRVVESIEHFKHRDDYNGRNVYQRNYDPGDLIAFNENEAHLFIIEGETFYSVKESAVLFVVFEPRTPSMRR